MDKFYIRKNFFFFNTKGRVCEDKHGDWDAVLIKVISCIMTCYNIVVNMLYVGLLISSQYIFINRKLCAKFVEI